MRVVDNCVCGINWIVYYEPKNCALSRIINDVLHKIEGGFSKMCLSINDQYRP